MLIFDVAVIALAVLFIVAGLRAGGKKPRPPRGSVTPSSTNGQPPKKKKRTRMIDTFALAAALAATLAAGCATTPPPAPCGAGGEVVTFPPGLIPGVSGKVPVNVGLGDPCPK